MTSLAMIDLINCAVTIPLTAVMSVFKEQVRYEIVCKSYHFLASSAVLSAFIVAALAFERYHCICHPHKQLLTNSRVWMIIFSLTVFFCIFGVIIVFLKRVDVDGCCIHDYDVFGVIGLKVFYKVFLSFYPACLLIILVFYIKIFRFISSARFRRLQQRLQGSHRDKMENRILRGNVLCANAKTAVMLFIVAVVFVVAFLPAWLILQHVLIIPDPYKNVVYHFYFFYNVANPFIYAFMSPFFIKQLRKMCLSFN